MEISALTRTTGRAVMKAQATWHPEVHPGELQLRDPGSMLDERWSPPPRDFAEILFPFQDLGTQSFWLLRELYEGEGPSPRMVEKHPPVTVRQLRFASPLQLVLDVTPLWATPSALAVLVVLIRVSIGIDIDLQIVRTQKKSELLEAQMRLKELERDHERLTRIAEEPVPFDRNHWLVNEINLMDEEDLDQ